MNHLLVVDDDPQVLIALKASLKHIGHHIMGAASAAEAVCKLQGRAYDLVITDVRMPTMTGIELLRQIKMMAPPTPVILLTAFGTVQDAVEAMKMGAFDYLLKPFSVEDLEAVVRRALGDKTSAQESMLGGIVTNEPCMLQLLDLARHAAQSIATILLQAESGTGKELLAHFIHNHSARHAAPFVAINCAALPESLLESELFGHEKGSFTGATASKPGKFELANGGTILLDEISEMAPLLQAKLLRVLQEREVDRVGGTRPIPVDVRVIATTNRDLAEMARAGAFRQDLFYRLNVVPLKVPALRQRKADVPLLIAHFCRKYGDGRVTFSEDAIQWLKSYDWPGNVRELENIVQRAIALAHKAVIDPADLFFDKSGDDHALGLRAGTSLRDLEQKLILRTLEETGGNRTRAACLLGISLRTLRNKLREYKSRGVAVSSLPPTGNFCPSKQLVAAK